MRIAPDPKDDPPVAGVSTPRFASVVVVLGFVAMLVGLTVFGSLAVVIRGQEPFLLDTLATPFLHDRASPTLDAIMNAATFVGSDVVIVPALLVTLAILGWRRRVREAVFLAAAVVGSEALNGGMKLFFQRARPTLPWAHVLPDYSFPSGHSMNSLVFYLSVALLAWALLGRRAGVPAVTIALGLVLLVGTSRIYLGYHYFTDVLGGYAAGLVWILLVAGALHGGPWLARWRRQPASVPSRRVR
jgi:membrane-associated phospholipid phosphatase